MSFKLCLLASQTLRGLGLVHNDLNPTNIMMDGNEPVILTLAGKKDKSWVLKEALLDGVPTGSATQTSRTISMAYPKFATF